MYLPVAFLLAVGAFVLAHTIGLRRAIWMVWWPSLLLPSYSAIWLGGLELNLPTIAGASLLCCAVLSGIYGPRRWLLSDYLVLGLISVGIASEYTNGGGITSWVDIARRWGLPYVMGRLAIGRIPSETTGHSLLPPDTVRMMGLVCLGAAGLAIFEALTHQNFYWLISGHNMEYLARFGFRRASGPSEHAIGFGMFFVCLLPWALQAARESMSFRGPAWWRWLPVLIGAGLFFTVSRGAWVAGAVALCVLFYLQRPALRTTLATLAVTGGLVLSASWTEVMDGLNALAGKNTSAHSGTLYIDGEQFEYTPTNHRYIQFFVYKVPIQEAGLLGHGLFGLERFQRAMQRQEFVPGLPMNVPQSFYSLDSHYLLTILSRGWLGIGLWVVFSLCALRYLAVWGHDADRFLRHALAGSVVGLMLGMVTVYAHAPFDMAYVFIVGLAGTWRSHSLDSQQIPSTADAEWQPRRSDVITPMTVACAIDAK